MNSNEMKRIEDRLTPPPAPEPPEELLERIQNDIPEYLHLVEETPEPTFSARRLRLIAASMAVVVLGGYLAFTTWRLEMPRLDPATSPTVPSTRSVTEAGRENLPGKSSTGTDEPMTIAAEKIEVETPAVADERSKKLKPLGDVSGNEKKKPQRSDSAIERERDERIGRLQEVPSAMTAEPGLHDMSYLAVPMEESRPPRPTAPPSTGGTHEPNDAPYGDMFFKSYGTNPFIDTEDDAQSTFGLDVDTGSFTVARSYIERGHMPPSEAVRVEEFVNYFDYGDPAPRRGEFTITAEGAPSPFASGPRYQLVRFGIKGREVSNAERKPAMLIFVVDVSGSMGRENRLGLVKHSLELLLDQLQPEDQVGLVVYGNRGRVLLDPTSDKYAIERSIQHLVPNGSTNAEEGLALAYDLARTYRNRGAINRIILCSDGVANVGRTGPESILERIQAGVDLGIQLTTVGFGMGNYNDVLMEQLANRGDGSYAYVDTLDEARRIFVENLTGTLLTIATDAKIQVEFNPQTVSRYRLLGYENRDIADHRFRDDSVDAGEIGAGHEVTALYEIKLREDVRKRERLATLRLRYRSEASGEVVETAVDLTGSNMSKRWDDASPALRLGSIVAEFAEILKGSYWAKEGSLEQLERRAGSLTTDFPGDRAVQDLVALIGQARRLTVNPAGYGEDE